MFSSEFLLSIERHRRIRRALRFRCGGEYGLAMRNTVRQIAEAA
jgi:hypothetical protein